MQLLLLLLGLLSMAAATSKRIVGGHEPVDTNSASVLDIANKIALEYDKGSASVYKQGVVRVVEGTQQVVAGMNYNPVVALPESNCVRVHARRAARA